MNNSNAVPDVRQPSLNKLVNGFVASLNKQQGVVAERQRTERQAAGFSGPEWDRLAEVWRSLREQRLATLWEYAAVANCIAERFGQVALRHFGLQVGYPERSLIRSVEAYAASHLQSPPGTFSSESEYARDLQKRLIDRGWQVKREAVMGFGRADLMASIPEGGRRRHIQVIEAKLSPDWRAAAQALGQLQFYRGGLAGTRGVPDYGLWFACPTRPDREVIDVLLRHGVGYIG